MRQQLHRRLQLLEKESAIARAQRATVERERGPSIGIQKCEWFLKLRGIEQERQESLVMAVARGLGMSSWDFRELLAQGIDPIHRYYEKEGIIEALKTKKPPVARPAAGRMI